MKAKIIMIAGNVVDIRTTNIILNVKIVEVNFALIALKKSIIFLIILVLYVEKNFQKDMECSKVADKAKNTMFAGNVNNIKTANIILNVKTVAVNFVLNVQKIMLIFLIVLVLYVVNNFQEDMEIL